ncbi:hypothetical protein M2341_001007 [Sphingobium sp. B7D2B]|uniref:hypothetical protein n=1 Tax=Sphingobium sp. B7D2B TaxID=2940583 RepID=UPI0022242C78|nr:hypothetical protein [Sphingobium sp. B7D2B]MCW2365560.1 hypothetical protein [Sphingobium sp. B7D2B]
MASLTDPARELADFCDDLISASSSKRGDSVIARVLGVDAWSRDFYQIIFCVMDRADFIIEILHTCDMDDDVRAAAISHVKGIKSVFDQEALTGTWNNSGNGLTRVQANLQPLKMLSPTIRQKVQYPKLNEQELSDLIGEIDTLLEWLGEHQLVQGDFIRQATIDGLRQFRFRLERVRWLGWGYTIESLRELLSAYMALERGASSDDPQAEATLKKLGAFVKFVFAKAGLAKDMSDTAEFVLTAYRTVSTFATPVLAGYLTFQPQ